MPIKTKKTLRQAQGAEQSRSTTKKPKADVKTARFFEAIGRRKTAVARVRLTQNQKEVLINGKPLDKYFFSPELRQIVVSVLEKMGCLDKFGVQAKIKGGGLHAQSEALRHGIARALVKFDQEFRKKLKKAGLLTRDSRMRERKKFGLKRARRAPQWTKR